MNRLLSGAWGMHRFADAQGRDSVDIAACKRDDYQELILLIILRGRVLYSSFARGPLQACIGEESATLLDPISWLR
jgi:hypothetical protein